MSKIFKTFSCIGVCSCDTIITINYIDLDYKQSNGALELLGNERVTLKRLSLFIILLKSLAIIRGGII